MFCCSLVLCTTSACFIIFLLIYYHPYSSWKFLLFKITCWDWSCKSLSIDITISYPLFHKSLTFDTLKMRYILSQKRYYSLGTYITSTPNVESATYALLQKFPVGLWKDFLGTNYTIIKQLYCIIFACISDSQNFRCQGL